MNNKQSRRSFLQLSALGGIASVCPGVAASGTDVEDVDDQSKGIVFLFQGDSITDGNRGRNSDPNHIMGHGYAFSIAGRVGADFAESDHMFYNRGISGNRVFDLQKRWQSDTLEINPDVLSILIGINDTSTMIRNSEVKDVDVDLFETTYRDLLNQSKQQNPSIIFVLCLPFVYPVSKVKDKWDEYRNTVALLSERVRKLAVEFDAVVVDFPSVFDKANKRMPVVYWMWDGIHPTVAGHELMAREWIKQVSLRLKFLKNYKYK